MDIVKSPPRDLIIDLSQRYWNRLNQYDQDFIVSMIELIESDLELTHRQCQHLERVIARLALIDRFACGRDL